VTEAKLEFGRSTLDLRTVSYAAFPFLELRFRIQWNEWRKRLKLSIPTIFKVPDVICETPGGAIRRPADGQEHLQGRWMIIHESAPDPHHALAVINSGQYGFDLKDGELRISLLRSPLYCHERTFPLEQADHQTVMDQGVHEVRLLLMAGKFSELRGAVSGLADWISAPPVVLAHYPIGDKTPSAEELLNVSPHAIRLLACKQSWDGKALILRLQETGGERTAARVQLKQPAISMTLEFDVFEIKTVRVERDGKWREVEMIEEGE
jgi:alpha-mannosidase